MQNFAVRNSSHTRVDSLSDAAIHPLDVMLQPVRQKIQHFEQCCLLLGIHLLQIHRVQLPDELRMLVQLAEATRIIDTFHIFFLMRKMGLGIIAQFLHDSHDMIIFIRHEIICQ